MVHFNADFVIAFRYYQPPSLEEFRHVAPINTGNDFVRESGLLSAVDPILAAFANLTTRVMNMRRCVVSMTGAGTSYVIAESTRTLSLTYPHTHEPGDALMLGGGVATSSLGGLCEVGLEGANSSSARLTPKTSTPVRFFHLLPNLTNLSFSRYPICQSIRSSTTLVMYGIGHTLDSTAGLLSERKTALPLERSV